MNKDKIKQLEEEKEKYMIKLKQMQKLWGESRGGSRYGDESLDIQIKVYIDMISQIETETRKLKISKK